MNNTTSDLGAIIVKVKEERAWLGAFALIASIVSLALIVFYFLYPDSRDRILAEDDVLENATAVLYAAAIIVAFTRLCLARSKKAVWVSVLILALGLFGALEEVSWGGRLLGFEPIWILEVKIDTLHDLIFLTAKIFKNLAETYGTGWYLLPVVIGACFCYLIYRFRVPIIATIRPLLLEKPFLFIFLALIIGVVSVALDLGIIHADILQCLEEILEFDAALALLFGSFCLYYY
ncbi:MAG: hypothetical protein ABFS02_02400 [Pseudomonadota bacterium]